MRSTKFGSQRGIEILDWERALRWWPYDNVLRAEKHPKGQFVEVVAAGSEEGGTKGDPRSKSAILEALYLGEDADLEEGTIVEIRDQGGVFVISEFYPPGSTPPWSDPFWLTFSEDVHVRSQNAKIIEMSKKNESNQNYRIVFWQHPRNGGFVQWRIENSTEVYSRADTLSFIEALVKLT